MELNLPAFALAFGIWWGVGVFILAWWLIWTGAEPGSESLLENWYPGYALTPIGSVIGLAWGVRLRNDMRRHSGVALQRLVRKIWHGWRTGPILKTALNF